MAAAAAGADAAPRMLSCVAGLPRCIGVPDLAAAKAWGCPLINVTLPSGKIEEETCAPCIKPLALRTVCAGQGMKNITSRDATPTGWVSIPTSGLSSSQRARARLRLRARNNIHTVRRRARLVLIIVIVHFHRVRR